MSQLEKVYHSHCVFVVGSGGLSLEEFLSKDGNISFKEAEKRTWPLQKRKETHLSRDRSLFVMNFTVWNSFVCGMYLQKAMACALTQHIA